MGMNSELVSILIPTYNRKGMVDEAIDCALKQTYQNIEVIVVDNDSPDDSYAYLSDKYGDNTKVRLYKNAQNIGPVNNWIECLKHAKGSYIKIQWSDDLMDADFIEKAIRVLSEDESLAFVYSQTILTQVGKKGNQGTIVYDIGDEGKYNRDVFFELSCKNMDVPVSPGCALFRKEKVEILHSIPNGLGLDHSINGAGIDLLIYFNALSTSKSFYYINNSKNYFRIHGNSFSCMGDDLYLEYFTAKMYFFSNTIKNGEYRNYLTEDFIMYSVSKGISVMSTYNDTKRVGLHIPFIILLQKYFRACRTVLRN